MQQEISTLRQEIKSLRREVRGQRSKQRRSLMVAVIAILIAAVSPVAAFAANPFQDLVGGSPHNGNIDAIYNAGITTGCVPNQSYCPTDLVTRQEMASFLARTAGLGGNQPVTNARTVQGFTPNALVRTNAAANPNVVYLTGNYQTITAAQIDVPTAGFVYVTGAVSFAEGTNRQVNGVAARLRDASANLASYPLLQYVGESGGTNAGGALSPTTVFQVTPGTRAFILEAGLTGGTGNSVAGNATISLLFVPFGPSGAIGADLEAVNQIAGPITAWPPR